MTIILTPECFKAQFPVGDGTAAYDKSGATCQMTLTMPKRKDSFGDKVGVQMVQMNCDGRIFFFEVEELLRAVRAVYAVAMPSERL